MCWPKTYRPPGFQGFKKTRLKLTQDQYKFQSKVRNSVSQVSNEDWLWHMQHHWWKQWFHEQQWHWQLQVHISVRTLHSFLHTAIHCHCGWLVSWLRTLWILQCFLVPLSLTYFPWLTELNNSIGLSSFCWWTCTTIQVHRRKLDFVIDPAAGNTVLAKWTEQFNWTIKLLLVGPTNERKTKTIQTKWPKWPPIEILKVNPLKTRPKLQARQGAPFGEPTLRGLKILRMVRLARILRIVRVARFFSELRAAWMDH